MSSHHISIHLDGGETVRTSGGTNHDAIYLGRLTSETGFVLPHTLSTADRVRILDELATAAKDLAHDIARREAVAS